MDVEAGPPLSKFGARPPTNPLIRRESTRLQIGIFLLQSFLAAASSALIICIALLEGLQRLLSTLPSGNLGDIFH